eukprot:364586-Chlamydomonas_euryale.AAC.14
MVDSVPSAALECGSPNAFAHSPGLLWAVGGGPVIMVDSVPSAALECGSPNAFARSPLPFRAAMRCPYSAVAALSGRRRGGPSGRRQKPWRHPHGTFIERRRVRSKHTAAEWAVIAPAAHVGAHADGQPGGRSRRAAVAALPQHAARAVGRHRAGGRARPVAGHRARSATRGARQPWRAGHI